MSNLLYKYIRINVRSEWADFLYVSGIWIAINFYLIAFTDISKHYSQKATIEHELPTATQKLITTNDCILSSLVALTNGAGKVIVFWFILVSNMLPFKK